LLLIYALALTLPLHGQFIKSRYKCINSEYAEITISTLEDLMSEPKGGIFHLDKPRSIFREKKPAKTMK